VLDRQHPAPLTARDIHPAPTTPAATTATSQTPRRALYHPATGREQPSRRGPRRLQGALTAAQIDPGAADDLNRELDDIDHTWPQATQKTRSTRSDR